MILMCWLKNHHKLGKQKHTGVLGDLAQSFSRCLCLVCTYNFSYAHGHHQPTTCAPENDQENHEIASFKKHSCFENRIPKINNVFPKTAVTFLEAGTLNAPRKHQISPPGTKNPHLSKMIQGIPPKKIIGNIDLFMFSIPLHIYQVMSGVRATIL
jgi:hypothetical protein